jgi:hypothetical protein
MRSKIQQVRFLAKEEKEYYKTIIKILGIDTFVWNFDLPISLQYFHDIIGTFDLVLIGTLS